MRGGFDFIEVEIGMPDGRILKTEFSAIDGAERDVTIVSCGTDAVRKAAPGGIDLGFAVAGPGTGMGVLIVIPQLRKMLIPQGGLAKSYGLGEVVFGTGERVGGILCGNDRSDDVE